MDNVMEEFASPEAHAQDSYNMSPACQIPTGQVFDTRKLNSRSPTMDNSPLKNSIIVAEEARTQTKELAKSDLNTARQLEKKIEFALTYLTSQAHTYGNIQNEKLKVLRNARKTERKKMLDAQVQWKEEMRTTELKKRENFQRILKNKDVQIKSLKAKLSKNQDTIETMKTTIKSFGKKECALKERLKSQEDALNELYVQLAKDADILVKKQEECYDQEQINQLTETLEDTKHLLESRTLQFRSFFELWGLEVVTSSLTAKEGLNLEELLHEVKEIMNNQDELITEQKEYIRSLSERISDEEESNKNLMNHILMLEKENSSLFATHLELPKINSVDDLMTADGMSSILELTRKESSLRMDVEEFKTEQRIAVMDLEIRRGAIINADIKKSLDEVTRHNERLVNDYNAHLESANIQLHDMEDIYQDETSLLKGMLADTRKDLERSETLRLSEEESRTKEHAEEKERLRNVLDESEKTSRESEKTSRELKKTVLENHLTFQRENDELLRKVELTTRELEAVKAEKEKIAKDLEEHSRKDVVENLEKDLSSSRASLSLLSDQYEDLQQSHTKIKEKYRKSITSLEKSIDQMENGHKQEIQRITDEHAEATKLMASEMRAYQEVVVNELKKSHEQQIITIQETYTNREKDMKMSQERQLRMIREGYSNQERERVQDHNSELGEIRDQLKKRASVQIEAAITKLNETHKRELDSVNVRRKSSVQELQHSHKYVISDMETVFSETMKIAVKKAKAEAMSSDLKQLQELNELVIQGNTRNAALQLEYKERLEETERKFSKEIAQMKEQHSRDLKAKIDTIGVTEYEFQQKTEGLHETLEKLKVDHHRTLRQSKVATDIEQEARLQLQAQLNEEMLEDCYQKIRDKDAALRLANNNYTRVLNDIKGQHGVTLRESNRKFQEGQAKIMELKEAIGDLNATIKYFDIQLSQSEKELEMQSSIQQAQEEDYRTRLYELEKHMSECKEREKKYRSQAKVLRISLHRLMNQNGYYADDANFKTLRTQAEQKELQLRLHNQIENIRDLEQALSQLSEENRACKTKLLLMSEINENQKDEIRVLIESGKYIRRENNDLKESLVEIRHELRTRIDNAIDVEVSDDFDVPKSGDHTEECSERLSESQQSPSLASPDRLSSYDSPGS